MIFLSRLKSDIESKSSNNTYLDIVEIFFLFKKNFRFEEHLIQKFSNNADQRKQDFLSEEKMLCLILVFRLFLLL